MNIELTEKQKIQILNSEDIYSIMQEVLLREEKIDQEKEHFWIVSLAQSNMLQNIELVSLGSVNAANVEPMNVFRIAVMKGAVKVIMVHNHPSGKLKPSDEDKDLTDRLIQVGRILNIEVLDHLIISSKSYFSFLNEELMAELKLSIKWIPQFELAERIRNQEKTIRELAVKVSVHNRNIEIAKNALKEGFTVEQIMKLTGLSKEEIGEIQINKPKK